VDASSFYPYRINQPNHETLKLNLPGGRITVMIIALRILPIFILTMLSIVYFNSNQPSAEFASSLALIGVMTCLLFLVKITLHVSINSLQLELITYSFFFSKRTQYMVSDVEYIQALYSGLVRRGSISYKMKLKNNKWVEFMRQSTLTATEEDMKVVCNELKQITKREVRIEIVKH
jgi:hypothetical protein